jgi:hypothetical protein
MYESLVLPPLRVRARGIPVPPFLTVIYVDPEEHGSKSVVCVCVRERERESRREWETERRSTDGKDALRTTYQKANDSVAIAASTHHARRTSCHSNERRDSRAAAAKKTVTARTRPAVVVAQPLRS